jgi:hypothetical protein
VIEINGMDYQLVPLHDHCRNIAETLSTCSKIVLLLYSVQPTFYFHCKYGAKFFVMQSTN